MFRCVSIVAFSEESLFGVRNRTSRVTTVRKPSKCYPRRSLRATGDTRFNIDQSRLPIPKRQNMKNTSQCDVCATANRLLLRFRATRLGLFV